MASFEYFKPLGDAWDRMVSLLFKPFNFTVWLKIGFLAWLCFLFENPLGGFFIPPIGELNKHPKSFSLPAEHCKPDGSIDSWLHQAGFAKFPFIAQTAPSHSNIDPIDAFFKNLTPTQIGVIIGLGISLLLIFIVLALLVSWVKSHGKFLFIDSLVRGPEIPLTDRWKRFRKQGNSYFLFKIALCAITIAAISIPIGAAVFFIVKLSLPGMAQTDTPLYYIALMVFSFLIAFAIALVIGIFGLLVSDFGTLYMYKTGCGAWKAAGKSLSFAISHPWIYFKYLLCLFMIAAAVLAGVIAFNIIGCCTCCIGCIFQYVPFIWILVMLPALAFRQLFTIEFIAQAGEEFQLFGTQEEGMKHVNTI